MNEQTCKERNIPERLITNNRAEISLFEADEEIFRWVLPKTEFYENGKLSSSAVSGAFSPFVDISTNRSSLCKYPCDVLYNTSGKEHRFNYGIIKGFVEKIENCEQNFTYIDADGQKIGIIGFAVAHNPVTCMYPHSDVQIVKDGVVQKSELAPKNLRIVAREALADFFVLCQKPNVNYKPPGD